MTEILLLLLAMVLVAACGGFVAAEFALITVGRASVEARAARGDKRATGVLKALRTLSTQLSAAQVGITVTNLGIGFLAEPAIAALLHDPLRNAGLDEDVVTPVSLSVALVLATSITMVFGELIPKNLAIARPMETARAVQGFQRGFTKSTAWVVRFFNGTANRILRQIGIEPQEELASARSAEELHALVRHSAKSGTLATETADLVERSLAFGERRAYDAMTPRGQFRALSPTDSIAQMIELAGTTGHSRFPVLEIHDDVNRAVGVAHVRHGLAVPHHERATTPAATIMAEPVVVPDTVPLDNLMDTLRAGGLQMALVVNEFGDLTGLVTLEDLVEEIVGAVRDEHDLGDEQPRQTQDGSWLLPGLLRTDEASEVLGVTVPQDEEYETIAGIIAFRLERVAQVGDIVDVRSDHVPGEPNHTIELTVTEVDDHRISMVRARVHDASDNGDRPPTARSAMLTSTTKRGRTDE